MPKAFVCINSESGSVEVVNDLKRIDGVCEVYSSRGMYEAIAMVQADTFDKLKEIVSQQVRKIGDIKSTLTLTLIEENLSHDNP